MATTAMDENENPVGINVVPMVDVIFCLCVFFMCTFEFKAREGRFDAWLPRDRGGPPPSARPSPIDEVRVVLDWDEVSRTTTRRLRARVVRDDDDLRRRIEEAREASVALGFPPPAVIVDSEPSVPWKEAVRVIDLCRRGSVERIEFAPGARLPGGGR